MREFLSAHEILFSDRNIRKSVVARDELQERAGNLVVPQLFWNDCHIVGFDPAALDELVIAIRDAAS